MMKLDQNTILITVNNDDIGNDNETDSKKGGVGSKTNKKQKKQKLIDLSKKKK